MDPRIRTEVASIWDAMLDCEYRVVEQTEKSLGRNDCRLLDVGCGSRGLLGRKGERLASLKPHSIGMDLDVDALSHNVDVRHRAGASCYALPLKNNSVDIILCRWVFEHLEFPEKAMQEFSRVLKPGGMLYIKTPNLLNYTMLLSWATPVVFHNLLRSANGHSDNIPTFYRANTKRRLASLAAETGFTVRHLESHPYSYMYYAFNKELFVTMRGISSAVGKMTDSLHQTLLCVLQKA